MPSETPPQTRLRSRGIAVLAATAIVAAFGLTQPAAAAPPLDPPAAAATWLAGQVSPQGTLEGFTPGLADYGSTLQGIIALAGVGHELPTARAMLEAVNGDIDQVVVVAGEDDPGRLALLILANSALGNDPTDVGGVDLVARLQATQRVGPDPDAGLFGAADPTFDGAFRQGLALMALGSVGSGNPAGAAWLSGQQCPSGAWVAYRDDTAAPCPATNPAAFSGPDTNSTAVALMGLQSQAATPAADPVAWLLSVRTPQGGWPYLGASSEAPDASSTGLVLTALRTAGSADTQGRAALLEFQAGCDGEAADMGGFFFQPQPDDSQIPDVFSTNQALWGLSSLPFPLVDAQVDRPAIEPCPIEAPPTTATSTPTSVDTTATVPAPTTAAPGTTAAASPTSAATTPTASTAPGVTTLPAATSEVAGATQLSAAPAELARTGSSPSLLVLAAVIWCGAGGALLALRRRMGS
ncbi:MAG: hypothetical protein R2754_03375 [Microthrixaceae bacterium]